MNDRQYNTVVIIKSCIFILYMKIKYGIYYTNYIHFFINVYLLIHVYQLVLIMYLLYDKLYISIYSFINTSSMFSTDEGSETKS